MIDEDLWLGADKFQHFFAVFLITSISALVASRFQILFPWRLVIGAFAGFSVSCAKEIGDEMQLWYGRASFKDAVADAAGIAAGVVTYTAFEQWWLSRAARKRIVALVEGRQKATSYFDVV
jgi:uncharacterized protein YfiM (DUF2279 family)